MKTLYLVRHGESEGNAQSVYQPENASLSQKGKEQALTLQKRFEHISIEAFYATSLKRARETAEIINEVLNLPIQTTDLVREWKKPTSLIGKEIGGKEADEFHLALKARDGDPYWKWKDEESMGEVRDRVVAFLEEMKQLPQKNILVVMHSLPLKMILSIILFGPERIPFVEENSSFKVRISNTGITVLRLPDGEENWELLTWNDHAHLG